MSEHKQFEIMCALAVVGQINDGDLRELTLHIESCVDCQGRITDFAQISAQALPLSGEKYRNSNRRLPQEMTARFLERARAEGIPLRKSRRTLLDRLTICSLGWKGNLAAVLLIITIVASEISRSIHSGVRSPSSVSAEVALPTGKSSQVKTTRVRPALPPRMNKPDRFEGRRNSKSSPHSVEASSLAPAELIPSGTRYSAKPYQGKNVLGSQVFSNSAGFADLERPSLFRAFASSETPRPFAPFLTDFRDERPSLIPSSRVIADPRERRVNFAIMSLNSPVDVFREFRANRSLRDGSPSEQTAPSQPNVDWHQVWLGARSPFLRDTNSLPLYRPSVSAPEWPFSQEFKRDHP